MKKCLEKSFSPFRVLIRREVFETDDIICHQRHVATQSGFWNVDVSTLWPPRRPLVFLELVRLTRRLMNPEVDCPNNGATDRDRRDLDRHLYTGSKIAKFSTLGGGAPGKSTLGACSDATSSPSQVGGAGSSSNLCACALVQGGAAGGRTVGCALG